MFEREFQVRNFNGTHNILLSVYWDFLRLLCCLLYSIIRHVSLLLASSFARKSCRAHSRVSIFLIAGREEPDTDDELLGHAGLDRPSPEMERLGIRRHPSDPSPLQSRLEARHDSVQQVSHSDEEGSCDCEATGWRDAFYEDWRT